MPDRDVWSIVLSTKDLSQLHFDRIARPVTDSTFRAERDDQVVFVFGRTLFQSTNDIFSDVSGQPFVYRRDLRSIALKFCDGHRQDFENGSCQEVLDALLGRSQLSSLESVARGIADRALSQELEQRASAPSDSRTNRTHYLFGLLHGRSCGDLVGCRCVNIEVVGLERRAVHRLG